MSALLLTMVSACSSATSGTSTSSALSALSTAFATTTAATSAGQPAPTSSLPAASSVSLSSASAASSSASSTLGATLLPVVTAAMKQLQVPGVVVEVRTAHQGSWQAALGVADIATKEPMDIADHFRVGSITKSFTATVILQLAEEGKLRLDAPLAPYFPGVDTNKATIRQALSLSSGIPNYTTVNFVNKLADEPHKVWTPSELLDSVAGRAPSFPAGKGWEYSNTNFVILGLLAEKIGGAPLATLINDRIFKPLKMTGCSLPAADDSSLPIPFSHGYDFGAIWDREPSPPARLPALVDVTNWSQSWGYGTGNAICTPADLVIWGRALAFGSLLSPAMQAQRLTYVPTGSEQFKYGLGIVNIMNLLGHNGQISGYMTQTAIRTTDGTEIVVLTNLTSSPNNQEPATSISELISRAIPAG